MYLGDFNYHQPKTLKEALLLFRKSDNVALLAGGTDLLVEIKKGLRYHKDIISLSSISEMKLITEDEQNLYIGAAATHSELVRSALVRKYFPALADALAQIGSEQVRNTGTIGGNLCTGASCCDSAPILMALNASVEIAKARSVKTKAVKDFFIFNKKTILKKGEMVSRIIIPKPLPGVGAHYEKFGLREAGNISVASVAVMVKIENGICADACVVIGAVAPTPKISKKASKKLLGINISELTEDSKLLNAIGAAAVKDSVPIDDIRGGAKYRRDILQVLANRAILKAVKNSKKLMGINGH